MSFLLGQLFVRWALRDLHTLSQQVCDLHIDNLSFEYSLDHLPKNDELRIIAHALQEMGQRLTLQVQDIKQFVNNVSHELRTPLMVLRSSHELALKSKQYKVLLDKNLTTI